MSGTTDRVVSTEYVCPSCGARIVVPQVQKEGQVAPVFPFDVEHIAPTNHHLTKR